MQTRWSSLHFATRLFAVAVLALGGLVSAPVAHGAAGNVDPNAKRLLDQLIPYAQKAIEQSGSFVPFGGALGPDNQVHFLQGQAKAGSVSSEQLREMLVKSTMGMVQPKGFVAAAVLSDTDVRDPQTRKMTRAIRADLRYRQARTETMYIPYRQLKGGKLKFGVSFPRPGKL